ncbi:MAG: hypothetical protein ABI597_08665 [Gammaproteobacteria bacterium]
MKKRRKNKSTSTSKINLLINKNKLLQETGKNIIAELCESNWVTDDIASEKMDDLTDMFFFRLMSLGSLGGMAALPICMFLTDFLTKNCNVLKEQDTKDNIVFAIFFAFYLLGCAAATKLSYHCNQFWNPFSDINQLRALHTEYKKNSQAIGELQRNQNDCSKGC